MLQVRTEVKNSPIHGFGCFAAEFIPKGTYVWIFNPIIDKEISIHMKQYMTPLEQEYIEKYAYREGDKLILCSDDGKYFNHSENPNCDDFIHPTWGSVTVANRDIQIGEELLSNYNSFDDDSNQF